MSFINTKGEFHVALDGVGLLLQGAPDRLAYQQGQSPTYGQRFASGDRGYNDLSQWWYFIQTDWSGGFKDTQPWLDDAKYYYSTNIDAWSEPGSIKLCDNPVSDEDFSEDIVCGCIAEVNGTSYKFIGTDDASDSRPNIYKSALGKAQVWSEILGTTVPTTQNTVCQMSGRNGYLWMSMIGTASSDVVETWDGTTFVDCTANIYNGGATISYNPQGSRCHVSYAGTMYVFVYNYSNNQYALVKTTVTNPTAAGDWSKVFEKTATDGIPVACVVYNGIIYYLVDFNGYCELWGYSISSTTNTLIRVFKGSNISNYGVGDKLLVELNGILLITIPGKEIWAMNSTDLTRIWVRDIYKRTGGGFTTKTAETLGYLENGCVISDNKAWWGNLMYDGVSFYNTWKDSTDNANKFCWMLFSDESDTIWMTDTTDESILYTVNDNSAYKGTADKNFIVLNNVDVISGVDKLAYSFTLLFKPFASGQSIVVEYTTGEMKSSTSWTTLGTASYSLDGGSVTDKTFFFGAAVIYKKIWFRIKLNGGGTDTPTMTDIVMEYLPFPTNKKNWTLSVNCSDTLKTLTGRQVTTTGRELRARLETAWWTKSILDFQDLDYATDLLNGALTSSNTTVTVDSTKDFPERGHFRIDDEEILYTAKTSTTFTGCTRGARGTRAVAHSDNAVVNNAYKVIISDIQTRVPIALEDKELEYVVTIGLREA